MGEEAHNDDCEQLRQPRDVESGGTPYEIFRLDAVEVHETTSRTA